MTKSVCFISLSILALQCLTETTVYSILNLNSTEDIDEETFGQVSTILLFYVLYNEDACSQNQTSLPSYIEISDHLITLNGTKPANVSWSEHDLEEILHEISDHYVPETYAKGEL